MRVTSRLIIALFILSLVSIPFTSERVRARLEAGQQESGTAVPSAQDRNPQPIDNIDPQTLSIMRRQEALQPAASALYEAYMKSPDSGFAGLSFEGDGLTLYWKGPFTPQVSAAVNVARETGPLEIKAAAYSMAEMEAAAKTIGDAINTRGASEIQAIVKKYDGSGLEVEVMPAEVAAQKTLARTTSGRSPLLSADQILAGLDLQVSVRLITASNQFEFTASRRCDSPPWNGGGNFEVERPGVGYVGSCTTGFGVIGFPNNRSYILTAAHCANYGDRTFQGVTNGKDGSGPGTCRKSMGGVNYPEHDQNEFDLLVIDTSGWYKIFDSNDGPYGNTERKKDVLGWGYPITNELLCQSGATSGKICDLSTESIVNLPDEGIIIRNLVRSIQTKNLNPASPGDSGGPVFSFLGNGIRAKGIVTGRALDCNGLPSKKKILYHSHWGTVLSTFGLLPRCPPGTPCASSNPGPTPPPSPTPTPCPQFASCPGKI
jgi:Trypsin